MSSPDSFIDEVAEEVRRDRFYLVARRYGWIAVVAVVAGVGGVGYWDWQKSQTEAVAEAFGDSMLGALASEDPQVRALAVEQVQASGDQVAIRNLTAAGDMALSDSQKATDMLQALIADETVSLLYRDIARLKVTMLPDNRLTTDQRLEVLAPLLEPGHAFRLSALELRALIYVEQNKTDLALADLAELRADAESSAGQRQRALQLTVALGGDPEAS
ncbi:tetratricopeptide repeat protein [Mangrovicoccus sp. HB161399]|uniref:tetratricopeptide repeat protein n=1 Tax=Mangrovicoccus sp. HB161399 TaxID=2720392 RepID=UPI001557839C|nr:tetratricopeptide repeat protein [Mangrovicoccus sp. HB161399]